MEPSNEAPQVRIRWWRESGCIEALESFSDGSLRIAVARRFESKKGCVNADRSPVMRDMVSDPIQDAGMICQGLWRLAQVEWKALATEKHHA